MGPKTVKRLAILVAILVLGGISIYFIQRSQVTRMARSVLDEAQESEKVGDYDGAISKYQERLMVFPNDDATKEKLADALLKSGKDLTRQSRASHLFADILRHDPQRGDIRRRLAKLAIERSEFTEAHSNLLTLKADVEADDGELRFLIGRCQEALGELDKAKESYTVAIASKKIEIPQRVEAIQRLANLLRGPLKQPDEADRLIDKMVADDPKNDQVFLARGRYRRRFDLAGAEADFRRALQGNKEPEVYLELADLAVAKANYDEARRVLQEGLAVSPKSPSLHQAQANLELYAGSVSDAIASLNKSLAVLPDGVGLRWTLAVVLAEQGRTTELMDQILELRRLGFMPSRLEFLEACYEVNTNQWSKAIRSLSRLQPQLEVMPDLKARVNTLLAHCYDQQGDSELQRDALQRAVRANPSSVPAQRALIANQVERGEIDQAIEEARKMVQTAPAMRTLLIELLIARNRTQPESQRDWKEVESLLEQEAGASPQSVGLLLLKAEMAATRGKFAEAQGLADTARQQFPRDVKSWVASAELLKQQGKLEPAEALLDQARQALGDSVDLRRERVRVIVARGGADLVQKLEGLSRNTSTFPIQDRLSFLKSLGNEISRLEGGLTAAARIWSEVASLDPNAIEPQLRRLDIAFQVATDAENASKVRPDQASEDRVKEVKTEVEQIIAQIGRIDGPNGPITKYQESRYLIWQARYAADHADREALRNAARSVLEDLSSRRPDWSLLPLALASITEQELEEEVENSKDASKTSSDKEKSLQRIKGLQETAADLYTNAVNRGQTNLAIVRRATDLLYATGRSDEVSQLWSRLPAGSIVSGGLQDQAAAAALRNNDYKTALKLAGQAVAERPNDFRERYFLAQVLRITKQEDEAVRVLREGVRLAPADPDRWLNLILFLAQGGQLENAGKVIEEAEVALPRDKAPLYMARYCGIMGLAYQQAKQEDQKAKWCDAANDWFKKAREAKPDDPSILRVYTEYLIRTGQSKEVEDQLAAILGRTPTPENSDEIAWARRILAAILLDRNNFQASRKALDLFEPTEDHTAGQGPGQPSVSKPEDMRTLARVYVAQRTPTYHAKAVAMLEKLMATGLASPDDRYLLAHLYNGDGKWTEAHEQYRAMVAQVGLKRGSETLGRYVDYLIQYAAVLLKRKPTDSDREELIEAQELVERIKLLRPDSPDIAMLEARILKARNEVSKAVELIESSADRPKLAPGELLKLATVAEDLGLTDLAERLFRKLVAQQDRLEDQLHLNRFLIRSGRVGDAIDLCEQLWRASPNPEALVPHLLDVVVNDKSKDRMSHLERIAGWLQKGLEQRPQSSIMMLGLGNLRERQGRFAEAEELYRRDIDQGGGGKMVALNNLAWLIALREEKPSGTALKLINLAIDGNGPMPELLDTRGVVYLRSGDFKRAIEDLKQAVVSSPSAAKYFHLAQAYLAAGQKDEAKQTLDNALAAGLTPESVHVLEIGAYRQVLDALDVRSTDRRQDGERTQMTSHAGEPRHGSGVDGR